MALNEAEPSVNGPPVGRDKCMSTVRFLFHSIGAPLLVSRTKARAWVATRWGGGGAEQECKGKEEKGGCKNSFQKKKVEVSLFPALHKPALRFRIVFSAVESPATPTPPPRPFHPIRKAHA